MEATKPNSTLDRELREMISDLTKKLSGLQQGRKIGISGSKTNKGKEEEREEGEEGEEEDHGVRIITLAGTNVGATMRSDADNTEEKEGFEEQPMSTFVNSNFQSINNSIMMGGTHETNDPGVHMDVVDYMEKQTRPVKRGGGGGGGRRREKEATKSDQETDNSN